MRDSGDAPTWEGRAVTAFETRTPSAGKGTGRTAVRLLSRVRVRHESHRDARRHGDVRPIRRAFQVESRAEVAAGHWYIRSTLAKRHGNAEIGSLYRLGCIQAHAITYQGDAAGRPFAKRP